MNDLIKQFQVYSTDNLYIQFNRRIGNLEEIEAIRHILYRRHQRNMSKSAQKQLEIEKEKGIKPLFLGSRKEPYWTEDEMINGYQIPGYKSLSISEQVIYDKIKTGSYWSNKN